MSKKSRRRLERRRSREQRRSRCIGIKRDGLPCTRGASVLSEGTYCGHHDPALAGHRSRTMAPKSPRGSSYNRGEAASSAKLRRADVLRIRRRYAERHPGDGVSQYTLAREYGVSRSCIEHLVSARTWRHLGDHLGGI